MNILQVSPYNIFPKNTGGDERTQGIAYPLAEDHHVIRYCTNGILTKLYEQWGSDSISLDYKLEMNGVTEYQPNSLLLDLPNVIGYLSMSQFGKFISSKILNMRIPSDLDSLCRWADVTIIERPWFVKTISNDYDTHVIYSSHDVVSDLYDSVLGDFPLRDAFLKSVKNIEEEALTSADHLICVSEEDVVRYHEKYSIEIPSLSIPNSVSQERFAEKEYVTNDPNHAVFLGANRKPNQNAVKKIIESTQIVRETHPRFKTSIVGSVSNHFADLDMDCINLVGYVEDLGDTLSKFDIALNPVTEGGGSSVKMIDYCSSGLPIVTSEFGSRGFGFKDREHVLISETDTTQFADAIRTLLDNDDLRRKIQQNSQEFACKNYTWEGYKDDLLDILPDI
ncbi:glycosyltransferase family 4 protein [Haloferax sp. Atlit-6N]|uniref:glycosyltransferase family 4 protein n=1 Tax=Haloferax sp. Atlit-6N TaxID=2077205 RepID=UPI001314BF93|nr:glycosyltransferase family 4 protein [Haloferax sp. Atlit-6N]